MERRESTYTARVENQDNYLKYESGFDLDEFKDNRVITVRSLYGFVEFVLNLEVDEVEDEIIKRMVETGRPEADELILYLYDTAKYPSSTLYKLDYWLS